MKHTVKNWSFHGDVAKTQLLAETFPRQGLHFLVGGKDDVNGAIIADLATALASDVTSCSLGPANENGARASLSGWMGRNTGARAGVAIVAGSQRAAALHRAATASALARGVAQRLPIAFSEVGDLRAHLFDVPRRLHDLREWLRAEGGVDLGLVVLDGLSFAGDRAANAELVRALAAIEDASGSALLISTPELSAALVGPQTVVVEVGDGRLTVATSAGGAAWAREFSLGRIILPGGEALAVWTGKVAPAAPAFQRPAPAAPIVREQPKQPPITSRAAIIISRNRLSPEVEARWRAAGFALPRQPDDALLSLDEGGRREIVVIGLGDQRAEDVESVANRLRQTAMARGVNARVTIRVGLESELSNVV